MNYPYPRFFLDVELAKKRLSQVWAPGREAARYSVPPRAARSAPPGMNKENRPRTRERPKRLHSRAMRIGHLTGNQGSPRRSERSSDDMTPFCFNLTLVLIGTIAAVHTDNPVFWLLAGPAPLVAGFMAIVFFRQGFGRHGPRPIFGAPGRRKRDDRKIAPNISPTESCRMM